MQALVSKAYAGGLTVGQRQFWRFHGAGSAAPPATGDVISFPAGFYVDLIEPCMDTTGTYIAVAFPSAVDTTRATFKFLYFTANGMTLVSSATSLAAYNFEFGVWGGEF